MLHLIYGRPGAGKTTLLASEMETALRNGREVVLLTPEQQAVWWEEQSVSRFPPSAQLHLEITNFTRLPNSIHRAYGGMGAPAIDEGGRALLLWRAMVSVWDGLTVYNHAADGREDKNIAPLLSAITECKQNGVSPAAAAQAAQTLLAEAGTAAGETGFAARLADAALVYAAYESLLHREFSDRDDVQNTIARRMTDGQCPYFRGKTVFVDSFYSLTPPEMRIFREILRQAEHVTITFCCDGDERPGTSDELSTLHIRRFAARTEQLAAALGIECRRTVLREDFRHHTPGLRSLTRSLFRYTEPLETAADGEIRILRCRDRHEEAEEAAAWVERHVRAGCRYRELAIVARDLTGRLGILDAALARHALPSFTAEPYPLSTSPAVRLLLSLLSVVSGGYAPREMLRLLRTGLTPLSDRQADCFARYIQTWNIRGRRGYLGDSSSFDPAYAWSLNPEGYRTELSPWGRLCLAEANRARALLLPPIAAFDALFTVPARTQTDRSPDGSAPAVAGVETICRGLVAFAAAIGLQERLACREADSRRAGRLAEAERYRQVWQAICEALDKMVAILGDTALDAGRFAGLFSRVLSTMEVGSIPTGVDEVILGAADTVRLDGVRHVLLLGAVEGEFPAVPSENGFFRDADRVLLEDAGIHLDSRAEVYLAQETWMFQRAAAAPSESLTLLCPMDGEETSLSEGAARIASQLPHGVSSVDALSPAERILHPAARISAAALPPDAAAAYRRLRESAGMPAFAPGLFTAREDAADPAVLHSLLGGRLSLTQSRLDSYGACPFRYFCTYGMELTETPRGSFAMPDIGTFVHHILEQFFRETGGEPLSLSPAEREALLDRLTLAYLRRLGIHGQSGRLQYLFLRLRRRLSVFVTAILEEFENSRFRPAALEMPVGLPAGEASDGAVVPPIRFSLSDGTVVTLRGVIDRVDTYTAPDGVTYLRVVDYKTGQTRFSLSDIRDGLHVQLLLYLFSLWQGGLPRTALHEAVPPEKLRPAGAVYFHIRPAEEAEDAMVSAAAGERIAVDGVRRSGLYLREEEILEAMDEGLSGRYVSVRRRRDGNLTGSANLATLEEFGALWRDLSNVLSAIAGSMTSGSSAARPRVRGTASPCSYCSLSPVCRIRE